MNMQKNNTMRLQKLSGYTLLGIGFILLLIQTPLLWANEVAITDLNFSSLAGGKVQIQLGMNAPVESPKVFQTDNPARIALDFIGVKSELDKKMYTVNQGAANTVFVVEASGRTRVVINLTESVPYETRVVDNNVFIILKQLDFISSTHTEKQEQIADQSVTRLLPEQTIKNIDFRRGPKGEGRLLLELSSPNTVVNVKEKGGKIVLNFLNTKLPDSLVKSYDVSDFATPVRTIVAKSNGAGVSITVTPNSGNFDYSSYQSDGLLTIDFIPLTLAEKEALLKEKFPYTGNKLSLNFQDIEVRSVLQILADFTELNIIAADTVDGTVTLRLNDVPWDQALDLILKSNGLSKRQTGNVVLVAPSSEIIKIEEEELAAKKVVAQLEPLKTEYIQINYAKAEDIKIILLAGGSDDSGVANQAESLVDGNSGLANDTFRLISPRGTVIVDSRTNMLIVKDTVGQLDEIAKLVSILDIPVRQVLIEARIVLADTDFLHDFSVNFGVAQQAQLKADDAANKRFGVAATGNDANNNQFSGFSGVESSQLVADLGTALAASGPGALALTLARGADYLLNLEIQARESNTDTESLANPRVMTTDRVQATIKAGQQIPFQTQSQDGPVTELIDAVLELNVTPQITPSGSIIMELNIKNDNPGVPVPSGIGLAVPINTREIITTVQVEDGETIVLGGIYVENTANSYSDIPWFVDLPGIGWLFRDENNTNFKQELLIFITPKIVKSTLASR